MAHKLSGIVLWGVLALVGVGCSAESPSPDEAQDEADEAAIAGVAAADPNATLATRAVLANLRSFDLRSANPWDRRVLFGQQEYDTSNRAAHGLAKVASDVEQVAGKQPGLVSYELSSAYPGSTSVFDRAGFAAGRPALRELILDKRRRGILTSLVWHLRCPKARSTLPDKYSPADCPADYTLAELLERKPDGSRGAHFDEWKGMLDELAELLWSLKDERGALAPVLLRPFHEFTGEWFWWGRSNAPETYAAVWRHMVTYLREGRGLHNVLWVFCPAAPTERHLSGYERYYPGDAFVDVVSFDRYDRGAGFAEGFADDLDTIGAFARAHGKVAAVAEVGRDLVGLPRAPTWFTRSLLGPLKTRSFGYVALWRNAPWEKFAPEPSDAEIASDFKSMTNDEAVLLAGKHDLYRPLHAAAPPR